MKAADSSRERVEGCDVLRTGWTTDARRYPVHDERLALCFDETDYSTWTPDQQVPFNHDDNRVGWRCEACVGSWPENYFLDRRGTPQPVARLLLTCPQCLGRISGVRC